MAEDVVPGLLEDIQNRFRTNMNKSQPLQRVRQRMEAGTATLRDVHTYTENVGFSLSDALRGALTPDKLPLWKVFWTFLTGSKSLILPWAIMESCTAV